jgi:hypothetical protein
MRRFDFDLDLADTTVDLERLARRLGLTIAGALLVAAGCGRGQPIEKVPAALTVPVPPVTQFVILASRSASFNDRTVVAGGNVGVAAGTGATPNSLTAGFDTRIGVGQVVLAPSVTFAERAAAGEIGANVQNIPASVTTGPRSAFVAPPAQPVPGTIAAGTTAVTVNAGQTTTLAAGAFGAVTVNGVLNLAGGLYQFQSLTLNNDARLVPLASSTVRVAGVVTALDRARLVTGTGLRASDLRLVVGGATDGLVLGNDVQLTALVVARGDVRAGDRLIATGSFAGRDVVLGHDCQIGFGAGFGCGSNASCNDNNDCTTDACGDARCTHVAIANNSPCSDHNACTRTDRCQAGVCVGTNPVTCAALDQCHVAGVCNPTSGLCSNPPQADGTACNDGNPCTRTDTCVGGACAGGNPVVCVAIDQCHAAGTCNPQTALCSSPLLADGTACDDGDKCTQNDTCTAGACAGTKALNCGACFLGDSDEDGVNDCTDLCIHDPLKTTPGICNCGHPETDTDGDGAPDCIDSFPTDPRVQGPGKCGGGTQLAAAGTPCDDGICRGIATCDGAGTCGDPTQCAPQPGAGCTFKYFAPEAKFYWFCPGPVSWDAALAACQSHQTALAEIGSEAENTFIARNLPPIGGWIGGNDRAAVGDWHWSTAASQSGDRFWTGGPSGQRYFASYTAWTSGAPTDASPACIAMSSSGAWFSFDCNTPGPFVCEVSTGHKDKLGPPVTQPSGTPFQCTATRAQVFGTMTAADLEAAAAACEAACPDGADPATCGADACKAPVDPPPPGSTCTAFGPDAFTDCTLQSHTDPAQACSSDSDCPSPSVCGVFMVTKDASGNVIPCARPGVSGECTPLQADGDPNPNDKAKVCGTPSDGCPKNPNPPLPDLCSEVSLCDIDQQQTLTGFGTDSNLTHDTFDPQTAFGDPAAAPTVEFYPDQGHLCDTACISPVDSNQHPWCRLSLQDTLPLRPSQAPGKSGRSGGDIVSFNFDPELRLDHTLTLGAFGDPDLTVGAQAGVSAEVVIGAGIVGGNGLPFPILDAEAGLEAGKCNVDSAITLSVLGLDFLPLIEKTVTGDLPLPIHLPAQAARDACNAAYARLDNAGDRAKKALRDATELIRQYKNRLANSDPSDNFGNICNQIASSPPRGFPDGNCQTESPEQTINRFIEYYRRTLVGFHGFQGAVGLQEALADLQNDAFRFNSDNFTLFNTDKSEEVTIFETTFLIGPIPVNLELLATMDYGADVGAVIHFDPASVVTLMTQHLDDVAATDVAFVKVTGAPHAGAGISLFAGVGFSVPGFKAKIGVEGALSLGNISIPGYAGAGIQLGSEADPRKFTDADIGQFVTGAFLIPPKRYAVNLHYTAGLDATVSDVLNGTISGALKLKIAFFSKTWRQQILAFNGFCTKGEADCSVSLLSADGTTDAADGPFPWGSVRSETGFPDLANLTGPSPAGVQPASSVSLQQVEQFFYDSMCTCIGQNDNRTPGCFRNDDCCTNLICFDDPATAAEDPKCTLCRAHDATCRNDADCCQVPGGQPVHCDPQGNGLKACEGPLGCFQPCNRDEECSFGLTCNFDPTAGRNTCFDPPFASSSCQPK